MPLAPKHPCAEPNCSTLVERGQARCAVHTVPREPWQRSTAQQQQPRRGGSGWGWQATKRRILARDGHQCQYCGGPATEVDHVINQAQGGTDDDDNLVAACRQCHREKTQREAAEGRARRNN